MIDGVNKVFILRHDSGAMHLEGFKTLNELAAHALRMDSWKPDWEQRMREFRATFEHIAKYHNHDHTWTEGGHGEAVCECGAVADESWFCPKAEPTGDVDG